MRWCGRFGIVGLRPHPCPLRGSDPGLGCARRQRAFATDPDGDERFLEIGRDTVYRMLKDELRGHQVTPHSTHFRSTRE